MKILATFDGSAFSESTLPQLKMLTTMPGAELVLMRVGDVPQGQLAGEPHVAIAATPGNSAGSAFITDAVAAAVAETKEQAVERVKAELAAYLEGIAHRLPGVPCVASAVLDSDVRSAIIRLAQQEEIDLIVMATHGRTGLAHALHGSVAESVLRAGIAPVLLVHPQTIVESRQRGAESALPA